MNIIKHVSRHHTCHYVLFSSLLLLFFLFASCGTAASQQSSSAAQVSLHKTKVISAPSLLYYQTGDSLYGLASTSGKIHWTAHFAAFDDRTTNNRAIASNGIVYAEATGSDGYYIYAFDAVHGTLRWKYRYGGDELQGEGDNPSKVFVGQGVVYLVVGTDALASVGPQYPQGNTQASPIAPVPTVLYKLDATTGHVLWRHSLSYRLNMPVLVGNTLYGIGSTTYRGSFYALQADDGSLVWQHQLPQSDAHYANLTFNNGVLYAMSLNMDSTLSLFAFSASNGQRLWASNQNVAGGSVSEIGIDGHTLYFVADYHHVYAFSTQNGKVLWQRAFSAYLDNSNPFVSNNLLYLVTQNSPDPSPLTLYTLDGLSGASHWTHPLSSSAATFSQIEIHQGVLYVVTLDGIQGPVRLSKYESMNGKSMETYVLPNDAAMPTVAGKVTLSL